MNSPVNCAEHWERDLTYPTYWHYTVLRLLRPQKDG